MAIGQGYVLVTPLQLAMAYCGIATGKIMKPHILKEVKNPVGDVVAKFDPEEISTPDVDPTLLGIIQDALHGVATEGKSVSPIIKQYGIDCAVKTGTAEVAGKNEFAWTVAYGPYTKPKYVCAVIIEEGGGGAAVATPVAAQVLKAAMESAEGKLKDDVQFVPGSTGRSVKISAKSQRTD